MMLAVAAIVLALFVPADEPPQTGLFESACAGEEVLQSLQSPLEAPGETDIELLSHEPFHDDGPCGSSVCDCCDRCYERCEEACHLNGGQVFQCIKNCEDDWNFCMSICEPGECPP